MKRIIHIILSLLMVVACTKNPGENSDTPKDRNLHGYAQKGQFVKGSQVTAFAVGSDMVATGESFPANISDDLGAFSISGKTAAPYLELRAEGYYFNEIEGSISSSPLYLEAFVKSDDTSANINLMTTAIRPRVKYLIKEGKSFDAAVTQAQNELLSALGVAGSVSSFDDMDITGITDADGILLAFACAIQNSRDASKVTTLIQEIASDLEPDGKLEEKVIEEAKKEWENVKPYAVIDNIAKYYKEKNIAIETVPPFWKYISEYYNKDFFVEGYSGMYSADSWTDNMGQSGEWKILSVIDFSVTCEREGVTLEKTHGFGPTYTVKWSVPTNTAEEELTTTIFFKDVNGKVLFESNINQGANIQYLVIQDGIQTKSVAGCSFGVGTELSVNGRTVKIQPYSIQGDNQQGQLNFDGVKVGKSPKYYGSYPAGKVQPDITHIARAVVTLPAETGVDQTMYYYGALAQSEYGVLGSPATLRMFPCLAVIALRLPISDWKEVIVSSMGWGEYLSGTASFVVNEEDKYLYPNLNTQIRFGEDASNTVRIVNDKNTSAAYVLTFPQHISELYVKVNSDTFHQAYELGNEYGYDLRAGSMVQINLQ